MIGRVPGTDLELLAALFEDPFASYAQLGRRVGLTGQGARKRVLGLQEEGVLRGFVATPVPAIFDREGVFLTVEAPKSDLDAVLALEDVVLAGATLDGLSTLVGFVPHGQAQALREAWEAQLDAGDPVYTGAYREGIEPDVLGPLEWRVLKALLPDPRASLSDLAEATGLTRRTVRDRRRWLVDQGAVEVTPLLGASEEGRVIFHLGVIGFEGPPEQLPRELPGTVLTDHMGPVADMGEGAILFCEAASLGEQHALIQKARTLPGVQAVHPYLLESYQVHTARLHVWIDEALDAWEAARGTGSS